MTVTQDVGCCFHAASVTAAAQLSTKLLKGDLALNEEIRDTEKISAKKNLVIQSLVFAHDVKEENIGLRNVSSNLKRMVSL